MTLAPQLRLRATQRLALTPDLRQRLAFLRMAPGELDEALAQAAQGNPFLRHSPRPPPPSAPLAIETLTMAPLSLSADLSAQLGLMVLPRPVLALARALVEELDDTGMLAVELSSFASTQGAGLATAEAALAALQACDPPGVGARDSAECLRLQLVDRGLDAAAAAATVAQLPAFARQDWARAGAALGLDVAGAQARAALLRGLTPRPALPQRAPQTYLWPDLRLIRHDDGTLSVTPDPRAQPRLSIDPALARRAVDEGFGADLLTQARALMAALAQRQSTLERIGAWLVQVQTPFLTQGAAALRPATRADLAAALDLHPSTISRALAGKAIDIDGRLWPMAALFSAALPGTEGPVSARAVQSRIAALIAAEPAGRPLADDDIATTLQAEGVDIARRTVAKYRNGLRIPSSSTRRRLAGARARARGRE